MVVPRGAIIPSISMTCFSRSRFLFIKDLNSFVDSLRAYHNTDVRFPCLLHNNKVYMYMENLRPAAINDSPACYILSVPSSLKHQNFFQLLFTYIANSFQWCSTCTACCVNSRNLMKKADYMCTYSETKYFLFILCFSNE